MSEPTVTAEDLTLYALELLEGDERNHIEQVLRSSTEARKELALIRGDLALFALGTEQNTPSPQTRQRLLKQVARERRGAPIDVPLPERVGAPSPEFMQSAESAAIVHNLQAERNSARNGLNPAEPTATPLPTFATVGSQENTAAAVEQPNPGAEWGRSKNVASSAVRARRQQATEVSHPADAVEDRYVPTESSGRNLSFASYGDREDEHEPKQRGFSRFFGWSGWVLAAAAIVAAAVALRDDFTLREQLSRQQSALNSAVVTANKAEAVLQTLQSPASQRFVLAHTDTTPMPLGRVSYLAERGALVFQGSDLEPLQPNKTYELWLIPKAEGQHPVPAGTFRPDARGYATLTFEQLPKGLLASNFGVTVEDEGGSQTPTLPILLVGQQS